MLENLKDKLMRIVALYEGEKQRADSLAERLGKSESELISCKKQIIELEREIDNLRLFMAFGAGTDNSVAKERISVLIKEIDKCIKLLED